MYRSLNYGGGSGLSIAQAFTPSYATSGVPRQNASTVTPVRTTTSVRRVGSIGSGGSYGALSKLGLIVLAVVLVRAV